MRLPDRLEQFGLLLALAHDASDGDADWSEFVSSTQRFFGASHVGLVLRASLSRSKSLKYSELSAYPDEDLAVDTIVREACRLALAQQSEGRDCERSGHVQMDSDQHGSSCDFSMFAYALVTSKSGGSTFFCVVRGGDAPEFSKEERWAIQAIGDHLNRVLRDSKVLQKKSTLFARSNYGLLLVDAQGQVIESNATAREMLTDAQSNADVIGPIESAGIRQDISTLVRTQIFDNGEVIEAAFSIDRSEGDRHINGVVAAVPPEWKYLGSRPAAALLVLGAPSQRQTPPDTILIAQYRLTPREVDFVRALVRTQELKACALELDISQETARRHVKSVFEKTRTHSQTQLIHLLSRHPATLFARQV